MVGSILGGAVNEVIGGFVQQQKILERVIEKRAQANLQELQKIGTTVNKISDLESKSITDYDTEDWSNLKDQIQAARDAFEKAPEAYADAFNKYADEFELSYKINIKGDQPLEFLNNILAEWSGLSDEARQQLLAIFRGAESYAEGSLAPDTNKSAREAAYKKWREAADKLRKGGLSSDEEMQARAEIVSAQNELRDIEKSETELKMRSALEAAGHSLSKKELKNQSEDAIIYEAAKLYGEGAFSSTG